MAVGAMLQGAITGAITSGFNMVVFSTTAGTLKYLGKQIFSALAPSYGLNIGNFDGAGVLADNNIVTELRR